MNPLMRERCRSQIRENRPIGETNVKTGLDNIVLFWYPNLKNYRNRQAFLCCGLQLFCTQP
jgi:hypothetical protein